MAKKSLTLKFGADTSKLSRAMKRLRTQITSSIGGGIRRGMSAATSLRGLALGGLGLFGASRATGLFRNLSPSFDKAYGKLADILQSRLTVVAEKLAPLLEDFADWIAKTISSVDVAELMDWLEPKVRKFGNFLIEAVDVLQRALATMRNIPSLAGVLQKAGQSVNSIGAAGVRMLPKYGPMAPLMNAAFEGTNASFAKAMARNEGASLRR